MAVLDEVRAACAEVARQASTVFIDNGRIPSYAADLRLASGAAPELDPAHHYVEPELDPGGTLAFVLTLDAINFGSGYFPELKKQPGLSGYFTIATQLATRFRNDGPLTSDELANLDAAACARIFGQDQRNPVAMELMGLFARALNDLGQFVMDRYGGRLTALVQEAEHSAEHLVHILSQMPFFDDVQAYQGMRVPFFKRALLTAADLSLAFRGRGLGRFDDLDHLTIFADNLVPHVLRLDGVLIYAPELAERIDREELIAASSPEEVELRACAVTAVERVVAELHRRGETRVTAMALDYLLWNRGQA
ncbi:MAG: hypothetical protein GEU73_07935, partial [Chloroflexi bacterium]|nr:hypothetical protein [Chloroflexota bacterium]